LHSRLVLLGGSNTNRVPSHPFSTCAGAVPRINPIDPVFPHTQTSA
jgi:hypothetical protein